MTKYKVVSLFSGAGGMDIGFIQAGFEIVWANDFDKDCSETYSKNIGKHIVCGDIAKIQISDIPTADVIIGGPPCQGFSVAGKMDPNDPRSKMLWSFVEVLKVRQPPIFVMENVRALGQIVKWASIRSELLTRFSEIGYTVQFHVLNSADYGVPQVRERVFFIGTRVPGMAINFPQPTHENKRLSAHSVLADLPEPGQPGNEGACSAQIVLSPFPVMRKSPFAGMLLNGQGRVIDLNRPAPTLHASMGGNKTPVIDTEQLKFNKEPWIVEYHRGLVSGEKPGGCNVPASLRRISVREAARLQTFPDDFLFYGRFSSQFRQIGNAVPPRLAYCIAQAIMNMLDGKSAVRDAVREKQKTVSFQPLLMRHT